MQYSGYNLLDYNGLLTVSENIFNIISLLLLLL